MRVPWVLIAASIPCILIFTAPAGVSAQVTPTPTHLAVEVDDSLAFADVPGAAGKLDRERVRTCLGLLLREMDLAGQNLPHIVVIHADRKLAHAAGVSETSVRRGDPEATSAQPYYELWIVGQPTLVVYTVALHNILEQHFAVSETESERKRIMGRVLRYLQSTVSVHKSE